VPLSFTAIDFETANQSPASPCAVGLVKVRDGQIVETLEMLFRPPYPHDWFSPGNIRVHGITPERVADAADWLDALPELLLFTEGDTLVAHNASFDMRVLEAAAAEVEFDLPALSYACSLKMARRSYHLDSYALNSVAFAIGHEEFSHHDALADSDACARITLHMADRHGAQSLAELLAATGQRQARLGEPRRRG
jgi:DNA polymerase III subunit epsilon